MNKFLKIFKYVKYVSIIAGVLGAASAALSTFKDEIEKVDGLNINQKNDSKSKDN